MHCTKLYVGVHQIWLNIKPIYGSHRRSKFGKAQVNYYPNSTATFNINLNVCGDIEVNPGPVKDPCGKCSRPVKCNQRSLLFEDCNLYWHQKCIPDMTVTQYTLLITSTIDWICPGCTLAASVLFASCSDASFLSVFENHTTDQLESSDTAYSNQHEHKAVSPKTISGLLFNARSLSSKQQDLNLSWHSTPWTLCLSLRHGCHPVTLTQFILAYPVTQVFGVIDTVEAVAL